MVNDPMVVTVGKTELNNLKVENGQLVEENRTLKAMLNEQGQEIARLNKELAAKAETHATIEMARDFVRDMAAFWFDRYIDV